MSAPPSMPAAAVPAKIPMKIPMKVPMKMSMASPAAVAAAVMAARQAPPAARSRADNDGDDEANLLGLAPATRAVRREPVARRRVQSSSSSSSGSSSSDSDSSDSDSSSDSSDVSSASSSRSSSIPIALEPTLLDIALDAGIVDEAAIHEEEEEEEPVAVVPPRPPVVRSFPGDVDKAIEKYKERLNREENAVRIKDDNKAVSLGTSKINYIDPRIVCSWAKAQSVPITKLFSATIIKKFPWAMNEEGFDF